jgi:NAD(P)-dependent dehydrogenase (short-subunit alcohol dehydrogenase family)
MSPWVHGIPPSKHAVEGWSDNLRFEVKQFNIDVIVIEPGIIDTEIWDLLVEPMLERSGQGSYGNIANAMAESSRNLQEDLMPAHLPR